MSMSAGAGSPIAFLCWRFRQTSPDWATRYFDRARHRVTRTGRTRPYIAARGSALGVRSLLSSHEYRCSCDHIGWTNHMDILRLPIGGTD